MFPRFIRGKADRRNAKFLRDERGNIAERESDLCYAVILRAGLSLFEREPEQSGGVNPQQAIFRKCAAAWMPPFSAIVKLGLFLMRYQALHADETGALERKNEINSTETALAFPSRSV
ncbi:hypothetical protein [Acidomonas methanolica]|uniref:hypothetical protein n=1 Tax=Acidomonas methanolica TaxID=437 RepID=UPI00211A45C5|nr:hypothetical protein [Acidomonas methanolica]MCQ9156113.1 hypothetical protein [Acidomonas methanolica]